MTHEDHDDLIATAERYLPGGSSWMWTLPRDLMLVIDRAEGSHVVDTRGRRYIDYVLGSGPLLLGHAHPRRDGRGEGADRPRLDVPVAERADDPPRADDLRRRAVRRSGALRQHGHRGDDARDSHGRVSPRGARRS